MPGLMRPTGSRNVIDTHGARRIIHDPTERASLPPAFAPSPLSEIVVLSDLWSPIEEIRATLAQLSGERRAGPSGADRRSGGGDLPLFRPHRVHRAGRRRRASPPAAPRPGAPTTRRGSSAIAPKSAPRPTGSAGASPSTAPTARRANCCWRCMRASARAMTPAIEPPAARQAPRRSGMIGPSARLRAAAGAARPAQPAGAVVAAAAHPAAPAPHRISADAAAVRHHAEGRDAGAHAVVADAAAARCSPRWSSSPPPDRCGIRRSPPRAARRRSRC